MQFEMSCGSGAYGFDVLATNVRRGRWRRGDRYRARLRPSIGDRCSHGSRRKLVATWPVLAASSRWWSPENLGSATRVSFCAIHMIGRLVRVSSRAIEMLPLLTDRRLRVLSRSFRPPYVA
jgi:hypothetical protein